jgi:NhaP-type Na+/H+ or K+/H+ antiporter
MTGSIGLLAATAAVLCVAIGALAASEWLHLPEVVMCLLGGVLIGPRMLGFVNPAAHLPWVRDFFILGVCLVLYEGGRTLRVPVLKRVGVSVAMLATVGVVVTSVLIAAWSQAWWHIGWPLSLILGGALASTDPAVLIPLADRLRLPDLLRETLVAEAALNDVFSALLVFEGMHLLASSSPSWGGGLDFLAIQFGVGLGAGVAAGLLFRFFVIHERFGFLSRYAVLLGFVVALAAFESAHEFSGSGFLAVFVAGLISGGSGNARTGLRQQEMEHFGATTLTVVRLALFILLGALASTLLPELWAHAGSLLLLGFLLMFLIRPMVVWLTAAWDPRARWRARELWFLSWVRETGVVPASLAGLWLASGLPHAPRMAATVFAVIILTIVVQVPTSALWARSLGLSSLHPQSPNPAPCPENHL